jgi:histidyl-tRNA synthetase
MQYQIPKGLFDILPYGTEHSWQQSNKWQWVEQIIRKVALDYSMQEVRTPVFERTDLFQRGVGETTDIVSKEMYTFLDKADRSMSLRPEGTASLMRAFIEHHLASLGSFHKFYYIGPMFRYERPQAGRYRQHHQFGVEVIGNPSYEQDVEVIDLLLELYRRLGLKKVSLHINSVGDFETRNNYRKALQDYFRPHLCHLSRESQERFEKNPLRILDSKGEEDIPIVAKAPSILDYLSPSAKNHFDHTLHLLDILHIPYTINDKLVRGLDYYTHTVFEVLGQSKGAQCALGGGGRYDNLLESFGGPNLPGVGFGTGIERILQTMEEEGLNLVSTNAPFVYIAPIDPSCLEMAILLGQELRHKSVPVEIELQGKKIQKALQYANKIQAPYIALIGSEELEKKKISLKNLSTREESLVELSTFGPSIENLWKQSQQGKIQ